MSARERWAWLAYLTVPGMTDATADLIVAEAAAETTDDAMLRIEQTWSTAMEERRVAAAREVVQEHARFTAVINRAFREHEDQRRETLMRSAYWSLEDVAFMLRRDRATISRWVRDGLPAEKASYNGSREQWLVKPADARAWAANPHRRTRRRHSV
jgi:hypothetical protein